MSQKGENKESKKIGLLFYVVYLLMRAFLVT